jgi:hypothetical protein
MQVFIQKRLAEFWVDDADTPAVLLGGAGYRLADYANGEAWDGEHIRFMTQDRQRDHRWVTVRTWKADGSSRLVWEGKVLTKESARDLQRRLRVEDALCFQDAQFEAGEVYDECATYGWTAMHGSGESGFDHIPPQGKTVRKFFSTLKVAQAPSGGKARYIFWSSDKVKDLLAKHKAGHAAAWEIADDVSQDYHTHLSAEVKRDVINKTTKQVTQRWCKIGSRPNHLWDCEAMQIAAALIMKVLAADGEIETTQPLSAQELTSVP